MDPIQRSIHLPQSMKEALEDCVRAVSIARNVDLACTGMPRTREKIQKVIHELMDAVEYLSQIPDFLDDEEASSVRDQENSVAQKGGVQINDKDGGQIPEGARNSGLLQAEQNIIQEGVNIMPLDRSIARCDQSKDNSRSEEVPSISAIEQQLHLSVGFDQTCLKETAEQINQKNKVIRGDQEVPERNIIDKNSELPSATNTEQKDLSRGKENGVTVGNRNRKLVEDSLYKKLQDLARLLSKAEKEQKQQSHGPPPSFGLGDQKNFGIRDVPQQFQWQFAPPFSSNQYYPYALGYGGTPLMSSHNQLHQAHKSDSQNVPSSYPKLYQQPIAPEARYASRAEDLYIFARKMELLSHIRRLSDEIQIMAEHQLKQGQSDLSNNSQNIATGFQNKQNIQSQLQQYIHGLKQLDEYTSSLSIMPRREDPELLGGLNHFSRKQNWSNFERSENQPNIIDGNHGEKLQQRPFDMNSDHLSSKTVPVNPGKGKTQPEQPLHSLPGRNYQQGALSYQIGGSEQKHHQASTPFYQQLEIDGGRHQQVGLNRYVQGDLNAPKDNRLRQSSLNDEMNGQQSFTSESSSRAHEFKDSGSSTGQYHRTDGEIAKKRDGAFNRIKSLRDKQHPKYSEQHQQQLFRITKEFKERKTQIASDYDYRLKSQKLSKHPNQYTVNERLPMKDLRVAISGPTILQTERNSRFDEPLIRPQFESESQKRELRQLEAQLQTLGGEGQGSRQMDYNINPSDSNAQIKVNNVRGCQSSIGIPQSNINQQSQHHSGFGDAPNSGPKILSSQGESLIRQQLSTAQSSNLERLKLDQYEEEKVPSLPRNPPNYKRISDREMAIYDNNMHKQLTNAHDESDDEFEDEEMEDDSSQPQDKEMQREHNLTRSQVGFSNRGQGVEGGSKDSTQKEGVHRIKLDYGWKTLLRGMRQCLREGMDSSSMFTGRHHWNDQKLFKITRMFIVKYYGFENPTDFETWAIVLLLNPAKGIIQSKKKAKYQQPACEELNRVLGKSGLEIFRDIFSNNNKTLINKFFKHSIITRLWPYLRKNLTFAHCFKRSDPPPSIIMTYVLITQALIVQFGLDPPEWWMNTFKYDYKKACA
ncbi:hypothetical protein FGO68_gene15200 [Halteria grandinella]|uniref:Uncharacterized protein n=1 Tax=Halteria grandinella TaxID=5974 RepID=A0A8J8P2J4_HALGN|nr:hypothetical protein FGO68_gene15200 [Halteria grandinella]